VRIDYTYHYRKFNRDDPEHEKRVFEYYRRILEPHLPSNKSARILDIGCGSGLLLQSLKQLGYENLHGVELDAGQAELARKRGLAVDATDDTAAWLNAKPNCFDAALATDVLEHIPVSAQIPFVTAIQKSLAPGATFICTVPNANSALAARWRYIDWTHTCSFTEISLDFLLHHGGLQTTSILPVEMGETPRLWWLPRRGWFFFAASKAVRFWRRVELMTELGPAQGRNLPLTLNMLAVAKKPSQ
jgi:cyclopropane fatty-acyl-phospholipid synthase-like methyltransferase